MITAYSAQLRSGSIFFVLSGFLMLIGVTLWTGRNMWAWPAGASASYLVWERGLLLAAIVTVVLGLALWEGALRAGGDPVAARVSYVTYLMAGVLGLVVESYFISGREPPYALVVIYVVLAFLGQTALGVSLLITKQLPSWIGWSTIVWNLGLLVLLPAISPKDIYYPGAHHIMPLVIGIAQLLAK